MLSKMAQSSNASGGGGTGGGGGGVAASGSGRRLPLSLSAGTAVSRSQQGGGSPQNGGKKTESFGAGPFVSLKKSSGQRSGSVSSGSASASSVSTNKEDEKRTLNGVSKSTNGKDKAPQNGNSAKEQKPKEKVEKVAEKRDNKDAQEIPNVASEKEAKKAAASAPIVKEKTAEVDLNVAEPENDVVVVLDSPVKVPTTPTGERKSSRKAAASHQKSPTSKQSSSPAPKKQPETAAAAAPEPVLETPDTPQEDVEMEPLTMDASPIRSVPSAVDHLNAQPAATSTPGRRLFGFGGSSKPPSNEVNLVVQPSSPAPVRTFAQISGRRSIRHTTSLTPSKVGSYRSTTNDLDTSTSTNYSMNATVGSEIPNSSSFSFSFFGRGRKRERTPPQQLLGSQSTTDLPLDMETSPPKRARFDLFSLNLASPFSLLRSRFSKTAISSPQRLRLEQPTDDGDENGKVQDVQCIAVEMDQQQLNISSGSAEEQDQKEVTVGQEAGLETPKKAGTPVKDIKEKEINDGNTNADGENISSVAEAAVEESVGENRSRCSIM